MQFSGSMCGENYQDIQIQNTAISMPGLIPAALLMQRPTLVYLTRTFTLC